MQGKHQRSVQAVLAGMGEKTSTTASCECHASALQLIV
jgi:hypothetical protein